MKVDIKRQLGLYLRLPLGLLTGFWAYYREPRKTIVVIACAMRTGSTLLKALLSEASDISNLPEFDFSFHAINRYYFYGTASRLSSKRIILLKKPRWYQWRGPYPKLPGGIDGRIIVLVRHPLSVVRSVLQMEKAHQSKQKKNFILDEKSILTYWFETYEAIAQSIKRMHYPVRIVHYETLVSDPERCTHELFQFVGSKRKEGVSDYKKADFKWEWGKDDGGDKINTLRPIQETLPEEFPDKLKALGLTERYERLIQELETLAAEKVIFQSGDPLYAQQGLGIKIA